MKSQSARIDCYIGSFCRPLQETWLETRGFSHGMIMFAIPSHGILFKCRAEGKSLDLEFGAFFSLLRFIKTSLTKEKIKAVRICSSNPEFVFALVNGGRQLKTRPQRHKMYREYLRQFDVDIMFVPAHRNKTATALTDYPSIPLNHEPALRPRTGGLRKVRLRPIQKGIVL
jgi:hypothetical protein